MMRLNFPLSCILSPLHLQKRMLIIFSSFLPPHTYTLPNPSLAVAAGGYPIPPNTNPADHAMLVVQINDVPTLESKGLLMKLPSSSFGSGGSAKHMDSTTTNTARSQSGELTSTEAANLPETSAPFLIQLKVRCRGFCKASVIELGLILCLILRSQQNLFSHFLRAF